MGKLVVLRFESGNFQEGFKVTLRLGEDSLFFSPETEIESKFTPNLNIIQLYQEWQLYYQQLLEQWSRPTSRGGIRTLVEPGKSASADEALKQCRQAADTLRNNFKAWLTSENREFQKLREKILEELPDKQEAIRVLIQTSDCWLKQLPWNDWDIFTLRSNAEIALSPTEYSLIKPSVSVTPREQVRILATIDSNSVRKEIRRLPETDPIFLQQRQPEELYQQLQDELGWDIIFFGRYNSLESITIGELRQALQEAIARGLKIAIFNQGLELADQLADLNIPQIIVMREPLPDEVVEKFLQYFLKAFAKGKSLYPAVREARENLEFFEREWPGVMGLPIICQHPVEAPFSYQGFRGLSERQTHLTREELRVRQTLLNKVMDYWVKGVLERSLHRQIPLELGLEERPDAVPLPWGIEWETPDQPEQPLPSGTTVSDYFDKMGVGRTLLILGEPGSGKTITLLELAHTLIIRARRNVNQLIPVVFNLSSWASKKETITNWLIEELITKYKLHNQAARAFIQAEQLLLLLDGLDEVPDESRKFCVQALNQFTCEYGQTDIVVTSRINDYQTLSQQLRFQAAVYLQPLTPQQIHQYLVHLDFNLTGLITACKTDVNLQDLAKTPLMLNIMSLAYQGMSLQELPVMNSREDHRRYLFDAYIERMFQRRQHRRQSYTREQYLHWLTWLAQRMSQEYQTIFLIEQMQLNLLNNHQKRTYKRVFSLIWSLIGGLIIGLPIWLTVGWFFDPLWGIALGVIIGVIFGLPFGIWAWLTLAREQKIEPVETLNWSLSSLKKSLTIGLIGGVIIWLITRMIIFLIVAPMIVLTFELRGARIETKTVPNQGIWQSLKNAVLLTLLAGTVLGIAAGLMHKQLLGIIFDKTYVQAIINTGKMQQFALRTIISGMVVGLFYGLTEAGTACIQHFTLRLVLYFNGYIPWNYARFLDSATERIFLQKIGGGYIFIHRLLQEHFARHCSNK